MVPMRPLTRLNLVLLTVLGTAYAVAALFVYHQADRQYRHELEESSERQMQMAQAVRAYTNDHVRPTLLQDIHEFHPSAVPSFAANQTMRYLQATYPGHVYREVALNPTNPANLAHGWEVQAIQHFRSSPGKILSTITTDAQGAVQFQYAKPITVSSPTCLVCHGSAKAAPATMLTRYGSQHGFGWQLGEVVGAQVVSVPAQWARQRRNRNLLNYLGASLVLMVSGFAALNWTLRKAVVSPIQSAGDNWRRLASEDPLTGAANRRSLMARLNLMLSQAPAEPSFSLVFVDIDHFKLVNDGIGGHQAGDDVLRQMTRRLQNTLRRSDMLGRYGGEEFAVLLPGTSEGEAVQLAEKLRLAVSTPGFALTDQDGQPFTLAVTASFGVAQAHPGDDAVTVLSRADKALYAAKHLGRDRVVAASSLGENLSGEPRS